MMGQSGGGGDTASQAASVDSAGPGGGGGISSMLMGILKDPQVLKEISTLGSGIAGATAAGQKISPRTREMLGQAMEQIHKQENPNEGLDPFMGDMMKYIPPAVAQQALSSMGIPYARMGAM